VKPFYPSSETVLNIEWNLSTFQTVLPFKCNSYRYSLGSFYISATVARASPTPSAASELLGAGLHDAFLVLWARAYGGTGDDRALGVAVDEARGVAYVTGRFTGEPGPPAVGSGAGATGGGMRFGTDVWLAPETGAGDDVFMAQVRLSDGVANWAVAARGSATLPGGGGSLGDE
jgi:hypothetical protein